MIHQDRFSQKKMRLEQGFTHRTADSKGSQMHRAPSVVFHFLKAHKDAGHGDETNNSRVEAPVKQIFSAAEQLFVGKRSMKPKAMEGGELLH